MPHVMARCLKIQQTAEITPPFDAFLSSRHPHSWQLIENFQRHIAGPPFLNVPEGYQYDIGKVEYVLASRDFYSWCCAENRRTGRSRVFFDIEIANQKKGRVVFELVRPMTLNQIPIKSHACYIILQELRI